jgi:aminopeptidase YwaD
MTIDFVPLVATHLSRLVEDIGSRPAGTLANHRAEEYIHEAFENCGFDTERQEYAMPDWEHIHTRLVLCEREYPVFANAFSSACQVRARTFAVGTFAELVHAELSGKIGVLYGDLVKAPLVCKSWFLKSDCDEAVIRLVEEKQPAALITVQAKPGSRERLIEDWEFNIPSATAPAETGLDLLKNLGEEVELTIQTSQKPGTAANVVGRLPGQSGERIVLCAHFDTKIDTPGATDNATGVAALLALARSVELLQAAGQQLVHGLELIAFNNEEYMPIGDDAYLANLISPLENVIAAINIDGAGQLLASNSLMVASEGQAFKNELERLAKRFPGLVWVDPWPESNHSTFSWRGVPSLAFSSQSAWHVAHQPGDTLQWVSPVKLAEVASLALDTLLMMQSRSAAWTRG